MNKTALITGISGQDGSYLAEYLLSKKYHVIGLSRQKPTPGLIFSDDLIKQITWLIGDITDFDFLYNTLTSTPLDEVYNLASQSYPGESWNLALETAKINGLSAHFLFDTLKQINRSCRIYQASSSEMYGKITQTPQNEETPFNPLNPYAAAKLYAHQIAGIYRTSFNLFISCGILFNHESPRRGLHFITQKVTYAAACLKLGIKNSSLLNEKGKPIVEDGKLSLGNLDSKRDWGYALDYVEAMWLMLQQNKPDDFVIGTGQIRTIRQLCETAFSYVGLEWESYVKVDSCLIRPTETGPTVADASKAKNILGWQPQTSFEDLIKKMIDAHLSALSEKENLRLSDNNLVS